MNIALEEFGFLRNQGSGEMFRNLTEKSNNINFKRSLKFENHFILKKKSHKARIFKTHCKHLNGSQCLLGNCKSQSESIWGQIFKTS